MSFWDFFSPVPDAYSNRSDIENMKRVNRIRSSGTAQNSRDLDDHSKRISQLEERLGEVELLCRSLHKILIENQSVASERLQQVMQEIDAEDGVLDGRVTPPVPEKEPADFPQIRTW